MRRTLYSEDSLFSVSPSVILLIEQDREGTERDRSTLCGLDMQKGASLPKQGVCRLIYLPVW